MAVIKSRRAILVLALLSLAVLAGCGEQRVLEKLGFIQIVGYDKGPNGQLRVSFYLPKFGPEFGMTKGEYLSTIARSSKEGKTKVGRQTNWDIVSGQLRNVLISDSLAREGVWPHLDTLFRDPTISPRVKISIVEGEVADILGKNYEQHPGVSTYLDHLLETEINEEAIPRVSLFEFERDFLDDGIDAVMPIIKDAGQHLEVIGLAVFRVDKYVGKIDSDDIPIFSMLYGDNKKLDIYQAMDDDRQGPSHVMLGSVKSSRKVKVKRLPSGQFELELRIRAQGLVTEYRGDLLMTNEDQRKQLERAISEKLAERAEQLISLLQEKKSESLGFGKYVRNSMSYRAWKQLDWREEFSEAKIDCRVQFTIQNFGKIR